MGEHLIFDNEARGLLNPAQPRVTFLYPQTHSFKEKSSTPDLSVQHAPANTSSADQIS